MTRRLTDILAKGEAETVRNLWARTEASGEGGPLPAGEYIAILESAEFSVAKTGTPGVKLTFMVKEPDSLFGSEVLP